MSSNSTISPLPDPNRHITDNDADGKSFFSGAVPPALPVVNDLGGALQRLGYVSPKEPAVLTEQADLKGYENALQNLPPLVPTDGSSAVWYVDIPPGEKSPMHRTVSLDIVVQLVGENELILDSGETRIVKPGDLTIQRSTMHTWRNPSTTSWTRMLGVMTACEPVKVGNETLGMVFLK